MHENKSALARNLGISRSSLYYKPKREYRDSIVKDQILTALNEHPAYGYRRLALHLKMNKKRIQRVMHKYSIRPRIMRKKARYGRKTSTSGVPNRMAGISPVAPNVIWAGDFTYLWYAGRYLYLATVIDTFTREVIGWQLGLHHTTRLVLDVLEEAARKRSRTPEIFHSDQGSEYASGACIEWLVRHHILPSHSPKGKPWKNGRQESFYSYFKLEFGKTHRYATIESLIEAIGRYINYYNTSRIHSKLKMPPRTFFLQEMTLVQPLIPRP